MAAQLRNLYISSQIQIADDVEVQILREIYVGADLNVSRTTTGTTDGTHTFVIENIRNDVSIRLLSRYATESNNSLWGKLFIRVETAVKDSGSWTDTYPFNSYHDAFTNDVGKIYNNGLKTFEFTYTPTPGELAGGLDVRITIRASSANDADVSHTLTQAVIFAN